jgi:hypothetical protein
MPNKKRTKANSKQTNASNDESEVLEQMIAAPLAAIAATRMHKTSPTELTVRG